MVKHNHQKHNHSKHRVQSDCLHGELPRLTEQGLPAPRDSAVPGAPVKNKDSAHRPKAAREAAPYLRNELSS